MIRRFHQPLFQCCCALLLAMGMVGAEFLALAHQVTARHVYCFEHGHMVDADEAEAAAGKARAAEDRTSLLPGDGMEPHAHAHCDESVFLKVGNFAPPTLALAVDAVMGDVALGCLAANPFRSIEPLFLAPKSSPPRAV